MCHLRYCAQPARSIIAVDAFDQDRKAALKEAAQVVAAAAEGSVNKLALFGNRSIVIVQDVEKVLSRL